MANHSPDPSRPLFIGGHLALDFINSAYGAHREQRDVFTSDDAVVEWLSVAGIPASAHAAVSTVGIVGVARDFRAIARDLVEKRMRNESADPRALNDILRSGISYAQLSWPQDTKPELVSAHVHGHADTLLFPVAEALATLLADADYSRIRRCGGDDCTLLFLDKTRSRRRRWCDMAICGNRAKISTFRVRQRSGADDMGGGRGAVSGS